MRREIITTKRPNTKNNQPPSRLQWCQDQEGEGRGREKSWARSRKPEEGTRCPHLEGTGAQGEEQTEWKGGEPSRPAVCSQSHRTPCHWQRRQKSPWQWAQLEKYKNTKSEKRMPWSAPDLNPSSERTVTLYPILLICPFRSSPFPLITVNLLLTIQKIGRQQGFTI